MQNKTINITGVSPADIFIKNRPQKIIEGVLVFFVSFFILCLWGFVFVAGAEKLETQKSQNLFLSSQK